MCSVRCVTYVSGLSPQHQQVSKAMNEVFGGMPCSRMTLETGMYLPWVSRLLSEPGHEVIVAQARSLRLIGESRRKDDWFDARTLARPARIDRAVGRAERRG